MAAAPPAQQALSSRLPAMFRMHAPPGGTYRLLGARMRWPPRLRARLLPSPFVRRSLSGRARAPTSTVPRARSPRAQLLRAASPRQRRESTPHRMTHTRQACMDVVVQSVYTVDLTYRRPTTCRRRPSGHRKNAFTYTHASAFSVRARTGKHASVRAISNAERGHWRIE